MPAGAPGISSVAASLAHRLLFSIYHPPCITGYSTRRRKRLPDRRSFGNLPAYCGHVYAFHPGEPAGSLGMVSFRGCLGPRLSGDRPSPFTAAKIFLHTARPLYYDGVGCNSSYQASGRRCTADRTHPYSDGRLDVYCRNYFLSVAPIAVSPRHLASVRAVRQHPAL